MLSKSFKFAACWDEGMGGWGGTEIAVPTDLSAPRGWRGTRELDKHWVFKHTHTIFGLITQGWGGGLCLGPPCWHRAGRALGSGCHSSKAALRSCFIEKLLPSLYSYPHLLCYHELSNTLCTEVTTQDPPQGHHFSGRLFSSLPHFKTLGFSASAKLSPLSHHWKKDNATCGRKRCQSRSRRAGERVSAPQVCWQSEVMRCSWEEKCHCTISQSSSVSFRGIQMPGHPTESPNKQYLIVTSA